MELVVHQGAQVFFAAAQLFAGGQNLFGNLVLLHVLPPGVKEGNDEEDGQHAVKQDLEGIVVVGGHFHVQHQVVFLRGPLQAQGGQHGKPVPASQNHIADKDHFKQQEQHAPQNLAPGQAAEAHDQIGDFCFPVALDKGRHDVLGFPGDGLPRGLERAADGQGQVLEKYGNAQHNFYQAVNRFFPLAQPQRFLFVVAAIHGVQLVPAGHASHCQRQENHRRHNAGYPQGHADAGEDAAH